MTGYCPTHHHFECSSCDCMGRYCQPRFGELKVEWPELKGVSWPEAKRIIEKENPKVVGVVLLDDDYMLTMPCCNRVILRVPANNCHNGPVLNYPRVG